MTSGTWHDLYTVRTYTKPSEIDIDDGVALANAWHSNASSWDDGRRGATPTIRACCSRSKTMPTRDKVIIRARSRGSPK